MNEWEQRVREERDQLMSRMDKLAAFIESDEFELIDLEERVRLKMQLVHMSRYCDVLRQRIELDFGRGDRLR